MADQKDPRRFILWDSHRDGELRYPDENSDGILGRLSLDNVYLSTYAKYPEGRRPEDLEVGEHIIDVSFSLSGEHGLYDVYRVV